MRQQIELIKFSWALPRLKRFVFYCSTFALFLSIFSCGPPKKTLLIDKDDREVVDVFLRYVAISEQGVYTLLGSKPVSQFHIPEALPEDKLKGQYEAMPEGFRKKITFKKYNTTKQVEELREMCDKWQKIQHKYVGDHFTIHIDKEMRSGYLVNIPLATYILREHYQDFSKILGMDFDPTKASKEIGNKSSNFWNSFEKSGNSFLWGLLFGYGYKNSKLFQWEQEKSISFPFRVASYHSPWLKKRRFFGHAIREDIENLDIPQFIIYQPVDEIVGKYLFEKEQILEIYKKRDFAETTVAFLKGQAVQQLAKKKAQ